MSVPEMFGALGLVGAMAGLALYYRRSNPQREIDRVLFIDNPTPMWIYDTKTVRILDVNDAAVLRYGYTRQEFLSMSLLDIRPVEDHAAFLALVPTLAKVNAHSGAFRHRTRSGENMWVNVASHEMLFKGQKARIASATDITRQVAAEEHLRASQASLATAQEIAHLGSFEHDLLSDRRHWSSELFHIFGFESDTMDVTNALGRFTHADDLQRVRNYIEAARAARTPYDVDHRIIRADGQVRHIQEQGHFRYNEAGECTHHIGTVLDITERKMAEESLEHLAYHDPLTGLANRGWLSKQMESRISAQHEDDLMAILFIDLDRFKTINDTLGHKVGDDVLVAIGKRLVELTPPGDLVARPGGDEFIIAMCGLRDKMEISRRVKDLLDAFSAPFSVGGYQHFVTASVGVSVYPVDGRQVDSLLRNADVAMYAAKKRGGSNFHYYTVNLQYAAARRFRLENAIHRALDNDEFVMHYQPVLDVRTGNIVAVEALLRWNDAEIGTTAAAEFIPFAEETGLIVQIGDWVFRETFAQAKRWREAGDSLRMWINVSAQQLHNPLLATAIRARLHASDLDPSMIGLELTEGSFINESAETLATLHQLKGMGLRLALDDFGVKYSALDYLQRLPIDMLKIDRSFLRDIGSNTFNQSIVRAIINIAHDVGFTVAAEGVETQEQLDFLRSLGCDDWQGHHFSEARPAEEITRLLRSGRSSAGGTFPHAQVVHGS
ncbi:MAG: EAL domain-containing protein [Candidatus Eremiobacteraeota bacterium]|nr:EAL domain-containing protein [Candidatus Eremiobacteraeota bacterium]